MRNPKWHRDEIILALDLYFDKERGPIDKKNRKIVELSSVLNKLPIYSFRPDEAKFRNANGVCLKLSNFLALDPDYEGKGMDRNSKLDREVFNEYFNKRPSLKKIATAIKEVVSDRVLLTNMREFVDDDNSELDSIKEGQILYKVHKLRERNKKLVEAKKRKVLKEKGKLECEVCRFDFVSRYGELGFGFIECHHIIPLANAARAKTTKLEDLALVCSNCHRMLHRGISAYTIENLKALVFNSVHNHTFNQ